MLCIFCISIPSLIGDELLIQLAKREWTRVIVTLAGLPYHGGLRAYDVDPLAVIGFQPVLNAS